MIKTLKNKEANIGDTSIFLATKHQFKIQSDDIAANLCGIQAENTSGNSECKTSQCQERPPLRRGISRNKSDPKMLPVTNVFHHCKNFCLPLLSTMVIKHSGL